MYALHFSQPLVVAYLLFEISQLNATTFAFATELSRNDVSHRNLYVLIREYAALSQPQMSNRCRNVIAGVAASI